MKKKTGNSTKKKMSEGKVIAVTVLLFGAGLIVFIYALKLIFNYFFPNF
jgi:hypothetical protein